MNVRLQMMRAVDQVSLGLRSVLQRTESVLFVLDWCVMDLARITLECIVRVFFVAQTSVLGLRLVEAVSGYHKQIAFFCLFKEIGYRPAGHFSLHSLDFRRRKMGTVAICDLFFL